jgi:hypothetical protein
LAKNRVPAPAGTSGLIQSSLILLQVVKGGDSVDASAAFSVIASIDSHEARCELDFPHHVGRRFRSPQTDGAIRLVAWVSGGWLRPSGNDFAMLRLVLLALLPQIGGILLMVSRSAMQPSAGQPSSQTYSNFGLPSKLGR